LNLSELVSLALDKERFRSLQDYIDFSTRYLDFAAVGLQAVIVSQNENHYHFYQYKADGNYNISRPINAHLMYTTADNKKLVNDFMNILQHSRDIPQGNREDRTVLLRSIYTLQQCIAVTLDALPAGASNKARKLNGDLFERLIQLVIRAIGVECTTGTVQIPVEVEGAVQFYMSYQHDLLLLEGDTLKVIGSVKTSSKDRLDKIFLDKFLYNKLTGTTLPHVAIFLNDVQRKRAPRENQYRIDSTFLPGHFKGFTIKLNPLDGVYYCDMRPIMQTDPLLKDHIRTIDHFLCTDVWRLLGRDNP
jgi:hypothetical protein